MTAQVGLHTYIYVWYVYMRIDTDTEIDTDIRHRYGLNFMHQNREGLSYD